MMREECQPLAETIARKQWEIKAEEEQSKSDYDIGVPAWEDLGNHQHYLINEARPLAWAAWKLGWRPTEKTVQAEALVSAANQLDRDRLDTEADYQESWGSDDIGEEQEYYLDGMKYAEDLLRQRAADLTGDPLSTAPSVPATSIIPNTSTKNEEN